MARPLFSYELSEEADTDLEEIFEYTIEKFGAAQAIKYLSSFDELFEELCHNPKLGRGRNDIRKNLKSISKESHIVFYRIMKNTIRIVRVLHASRDVSRFLPPKD